MRHAFVLGWILALAACSTPPEPTRPPQAPPPVAVVPVAPPPQSEQDTCGAKEFQGLVGQPRSEIPVPVRPERRRVVCTTCPMTRDFDQNRTNFFFDAQTGRITAVRCG